MKYRNPESYESLVIAIAMLDAASDALTDADLDSGKCDGWINRITTLRNTINDARIACLSGSYDVVRLINKDTK
jgi:hypothetical protein